MVKKGDSTIELDFSNTSRRDARLPEGEYIFKIEDAKQQKAKTSGNPMIVFTLVVNHGSMTGSQVTYRQMLLEQNLWSFRNMLEAMGHKIPEGKIKIRLETLVGKEVGARVADGEPYNNRIKSEVIDFLKPNAVIIDAHLRSDKSGAGETEIFTEDTEAAYDDDLEEDEDTAAQGAGGEDDLEEPDEEDLEEEGNQPLPGGSEGLESGEGDAAFVHEEEGEDLEPQEETDPTNVTRQEFYAHLQNIDRSEVLAWAKEYDVPREKGKKKPTYIAEILDVTHPQQGADQDSQQTPEPAGEPQQATIEQELDDLDLDDIE
jgi:hypothetical protein